jgi:hypothetical protein
MKIHLTSNASICRCAWCGPRVRLFRERRAAISAVQNAVDYAVMRIRTEKKP